MDGDLTLDRCAELARVFSGAGARDAWRAGLLLLHSWGVRQVEGQPDPENEELPRWLDVQVSGRTFCFCGPESFSEAARSTIGSLVTCSWRRVQECEEKEQAEERTRMLSQASFEGILIHDRGEVIEVNERLCELTGHSREELLGNQMIQMCVVPEDQPEVYRRMQSGFEGAYVLRGLRKDGTEFPVELQSKQAHLGTRPLRVVAIRDVTEREEMLSLLRESEGRLRYLADAVFDLTVLSRDAVIIAAEGPLLKELRYPEGHLVGRSLLEFIAPSALLGTRRRVEASLTGRYESELLDAEGATFPVEIIAVNSSLEGRPVRVAGVRDLRESRRQEVERRALEQRVERAKRTESLGVLAGGIAHDFNNLLVSVLGNAEILLAGASDEETRVTLESIMIAAERAAELTTRLLVYAGRGELGPPVSVDVSDLVDEILRLMMTRDAALPKIQSTIERRCTVLGDRASLTQVLLNLMTNAIDATSEGSRAIEVRVSQVTHPDARWDEALGATVSPGDWVQIEVEDFGVGMNAATLARVFEPFFTTKRTGHGLGMAGCLGIVESHRGALHVTSQVGSGTRFSLLLPRTSVQKGKASHAVVHRHAPCRVMVVDDERMVREQMRRALSLRGYSVVEADSGGGCLELLKTEEFDVILMDIIMPGVSGIEVVTQLREGGFLLPVVFVSGYFDAEHEKLLETVSFQGFLRKPYSLDDLISAVESARGALV